MLTWDDLLTQALAAFIKLTIIAMQLGHLNSNLSFDYTVFESSVEPLESTNQINYAKGIYYFTESPFQ